MFMNISLILAKDRHKKEYISGVFGNAPGVANKITYIFSLVLSQKHLFAGVFQNRCC